MTNLTIGRVGLDVELGSNVEFTQDGDRLSLSGTTPFGTPASGAVVAGQLLGYDGDADESFIPCTFAEFPDINGFYRVRGVRVDRTSQSAFVGAFPFEINLERVRNYASPLQEIVHSGSARVTPGSWNLSPNWSGESATTGTIAIPGTSGTAAITNPTVATAYGVKVLRATWSVASSAAGGGLYQSGVATPGFKYSAGAFHVRSSISNRLVTQIRFYDAGAVLLSTFSSAEKQVTAGTLYSSATDFKVEGALAPAGTATWRMVILSVAGTGYANWSIGSYLEVDGISVNAGLTVLIPNEETGGHGISVPVSSESFRVVDTVTGLSSGPFVYQAGGETLFASLPSGDCLAQFYTSPETHYEGAATLKFARDSTFDVAVGRQVPNDSEGWVLGNAEFEIRPNFTTELAFEYRLYISGAWTPWYSMVVQSRSNTYAGYAGILAAFPVPASVVVLRNTPAAVTIRVLTAFTPHTANPSATDEVSPVNVDITLRRGDPYVSFELTAISSQEFHIMLGGFAGTASPRGYQENSTPFRFFVSPSMVGVGADVQDLFSEMVTAWSFGVGAVSAIAGRAPYAEYMWAGSETQRVVA